MTSIVRLESIRDRLGAQEPERIESPDARAAVAAILREGQRGPEVLFIRRAEHPKDPWSGHMAFPGGRQDPEDVDLVRTAVRETREEVGVDLDAVGSLIGRLDDLHAIARGRRAGLIIAPHVFELREPSQLDLNYEVQEAIWAPLLPLISGEADTTQAWVHAGQKMKFPGYDVDGRVVWGLTYRMLQLLFERLRA